MKKFIITKDGAMIFGDVEYHKDLLPKGDCECCGGGFWTIDNQRGIILLYGASFDFGSPDFGALRHINKAQFPVNSGYPIFYKRMFAGEEILESICGE